MINEAINGARPLLGSQVPFLLSLDDGGRLDVATPQAQAEWRAAVPAR